MAATMAASTLCINCCAYGSSVAAACGSGGGRHRDGGHAAGERGRRALMLTRLAIGRRGLRKPSTIALFAAVLALYGGFVVLSAWKHYDGDLCRFADCGSRFYDQL